MGKRARMVGVVDAALSRSGARGGCGDGDATSPRLDTRSFSMESDVRKSNGPSTDGLDDFDGSSFASRPLPVWGMVTAPSPMGVR